MWEAGVNSFLDKIVSQQNKTNDVDITIFDLLFKR